MPVTRPQRDQLQADLARQGLRLRGGWRPIAGDALPALPDGRPAAVVWMVGVVGSEMWPHFTRSTYFQDGAPDPLDRWSTALGQALAQRWGGLAIFPFDGPPFYPFQQWAGRAEPLQHSPMMLRLHPDFGLWHAYRFALALAELDPDDLASADAFPAQTPADLCLSCTGQPCLKACPVQAYGQGVFNLGACASHVHTDKGAYCMSAGCQARRACPVGQAHTYIQEHAAFHMRAFASHHQPPVVAR